MQAKENTEYLNKLKRLAATLSVSLAVALCFLKIFGSIYTGSLAILSSLIDSLADVFASSLSFVAIKFSTRPASLEHRYGYGRAESISALAQAAFIAGSGLFVMYDGITRIINPASLEQTDFGIMVMAISLVATLGLIAFQKYVTKKTASPAIKADSAHYTVDVLTNLSIIVSLLVVKFLGINWFDILTAFVISAYLIFNAYKLAAEAVSALTDRELSPEIRQKVIDIVNNSDGIKGYHDFRSRDLGGAYFFEIHLELDGNLTLNITHQLTDKVEEAIKRQFPEAQVIIHQDPYGLRENRLDYAIEGSCKL